MPDSGTLILCPFFGICVGRRASLFLSIELEVQLAVGGGAGGYFIGIGPDTVSPPAAAAPRRRPSVR